MPQFLLNNAKNKKIRKIKILTYIHEQKHVHRSPSEQITLEQCIVCIDLHGSAFKYGIRKSSSLVNYGLVKLSSRSDRALKDFTSKEV